MIYADSHAVPALIWRDHGRTRYGFAVLMSKIKEAIYLLNWYDRRGDTRCATVLHLEVITSLQTRRCRTPWVTERALAASTNTGQSVRPYLIRPFAMFISRLNMHATDYVLSAQSHDEDAKRQPFFLYDKCRPDVYWTLPPF